MRLLDSHLSNKYETIGQILVRENAIVFSMEHAKLIIMADKARASLGAVWTKGVLGPLSCKAALLSCLESE